MNKQLKYLKIFEAFESIKLSKTLGYIKDKESKSDFLNLLKTIANDIDLPLSKYSDEYFQYLPFNKALNLNFSYIDEPCEATSDQAYPDFAVPGAKCEGGMIDRKWGKSIRKAECTVCKGTGIKKRINYPIKWFKFWFDKEGKYITTTGTDGQVRAQNLQIRSDFVKFNLSGFYPLSQNIDDYETPGNYRDDNLTSEDVQNLPTGTIIGINIGDPRKFIIGTIFRDPNESSYIIHNDPQANGCEPEGIPESEWQSLGRYSWVIVNSSMSGNAKLLKPKGVESEKTTDDFEDKVDPYTWNAPINIRYGQINLKTDRNVQKLLSDAHFAIVLNYLDLTKSGFKTSSDIRSDRRKSRQGATYLMSEEEIKQLNINRYVEGIKNKIKLSDDLTDFSKTLKRFMGGIYLGIYVLRGRNANDLSYFIDNFYKFMSLPEEMDEDKKYYYDRSMEYLKSVIEKNLKFNNELTASIKELREMTHDNAHEHLEQIIDELLILNQTINDKMGNFEVETLEDLEIFLEKYNTIRRVYKDSDRLRIRDTYYITENLTNVSRAFSYLINIDDIENVLEKIRKFKIFVERL